MMTTLTGPENAPTGDPDLDELLSEARRLTGLNWQCNVVTKKYNRLFRKPLVKKEYWLIVYDGGVLPWRMIVCTYGDLGRTQCFLIGLITGAMMNA